MYSARKKDGTPIVPYFLAVIDLLPGELHSVRFFCANDKDLSLDIFYKYYLFYPNN